ncbi:helix-turn-helix transcriptional regulator [Rhizobium sp. LEGMi198b]|uniref:helix-turn-helix transcriptional regulator n=1 Tax=unclassified Rhizobium TaxID=2613769 RepID=UPI000CDF565D|nr:MULTISPECIES: response regulator transcription factor [Rhizobium]AVA21610.1 LuxR family transcriptional regulator protein [Rhizobium sp. NXC24]MDK4737535.1 response regulator transcription factor [Rhizobium sp. CNPSo 3464]UWU22677.1 response regulator transcription factor [Rhizobium tropici]WFU03467.1 response regulator transcription factor [Rhizobium sp. CB3171]
MYIASVRTGDAEDNHNIINLRETIVVLADADLFSECLVQTLGTRFAAYDIISITDPKALQGKVLEGVKLILLYHLQSEEMQDTLHAIRANSPGISIGLVVETIDLHDPYVARLVEGRNIHGVLPLNLRLDVFMAAIDLLMKGGEHFPSALLRRLSGDTPHLSQPLYQAQTRFATSHRPYEDAIAMRNGSLQALTTREVQILDLICKGTQNKIIADQLSLSENTVKVHVRNIYKKMNVRNRTEAASRFFNSDNGLDRDPSRRWRN